MAENSKFKTSVGGQAVLEGIMMRGPEQYCLAVRTPDGGITTELHNTPGRPGVFKIPVLRGVFGFVESLSMGYKTLSRSAELAMLEDEEEEPSRFDQWLERSFGDKGMKIVTALAGVLGVVLALGLFMFLPTALVNLLNNILPLGAFRGLIEGLFKVVLFLAYLTLVRRMKEIRRVFSYHGAEHKTIACYEAGQALTVENVREHSRFHPRCGTSFLFIIIILSILIYSVLPWDGGTLLRVALKLAMLPVVMGLAYELLRFTGRHDNAFTRVLAAPGLWVQRLTTEEPDDSMIEVALAAVVPVLPESPDEAKW